MKKILCIAACTLFLLGGLPVTERAGAETDWAAIEKSEDTVVYLAYIGENAVFFPSSEEKFGAALKRFVRDYDGDGQITPEECEENVEVEWSGIGLELPEPMFTNVSGGVGIGYAQTSQPISIADVGRRVVLQLTRRDTQETAQFQWVIRLAGLVVSPPDISAETDIQIRDEGNFHYSCSVPAGTELTIRANAAWGEHSDRTLRTHPLQYKWLDGSYELLTSENTLALTVDGTVRNIKLSCSIGTENYDEYVTLQMNVQCVAEGESAQLFDRDDPVLYSAVEEELSWLGGDINNENDVRTMVQMLYLNDAGYTEMPDLSGFEQLWYLNLSGNPITELDPGKISSFLQYVDISETNITYIPMEFWMTSTLCIQDTEISNLDEINNLTLLSLSIGSFDRMPSEAELRLIERSPSLESLSIRLPDFSDLSFLQRIGAGIKEFELVLPEPGAPAPEKLYQFLTLRKFDWLTLENVQLTDLQFLSKQSRLSRLTLNNCSIQEVGGLSSLKTLNFVRLENNAITNLAPLADLLKLERLYLAGNQIEDISPLSGMKGLKSLDLSGNAVRDLTPLRELSALVSLYLADNQIADISALGALEKLLYLAIENNPILDYSPLEQLKNLEEVTMNEDAR